jgi:hypothetical protein
LDLCRPTRRKADTPQGRARHSCGCSIRAGD